MNFQYFRTLTLAEQESVIQVCSELMQEQAEREKRFEDGFKTPPPPPLESDTAGSGSNKRHLESPHALYDGEAKRKATGHLGSTKAAPIVINSSSDSDSEFDSTASGTAFITSSSSYTMSTNFIVSNLKNTAIDLSNTKLKSFKSYKELNKWIGQLGVEKLQDQNLAHTGETMTGTNDQLPTENDDYDMLPELNDEIVEVGPSTPVYRGHLVSKITDSNKSQPCEPVTNSPKQSKKGKEPMRDIGSIEDWHLDEIFDDNRPLTSPSNRQITTEAMSGPCQCSAGTSPTTHKFEQFNMSDSGVNLENDSFHNNDFNDILDGDGNDENEDIKLRHKPFVVLAGPTRRHSPLNPEFVEHSTIVPAYPKSALNGYGTVIELSGDSNFNLEQIKKLKAAMQYTLKGGHGDRLIKHVPYLENEDDDIDIPMMKTKRLCAGVKCCEFLASDLSGPHFEVDVAQGLEWSERLSRQEEIEARDSSVLNAYVVYDSYKDYHCPCVSFATGVICGGNTVLCSLDPSTKDERGGIHRSLFIGCSRYRSQRKSGHMFFTIDADVHLSTLVHCFGPDRTFVHIPYLNDLGLVWGNADSFLQSGRNTDDESATNSGIASCAYVCANNQGPKDNICPHFHLSSDGKRQHGKLNHYECNVEFYFLTPIMTPNGKLSTNHFVIISRGEHNHPPPPMRRINPELRERMIEIVRSQGLAETTARKLIASPSMPLLLNGENELSIAHFSILNQAVVNHILKAEKLKEYPFGTAFLGVQHLFTHQSTSQPYIRVCQLFSDNTFIVHCQSYEQSRLLFDAKEIQVDKTFKRTECDELEVNVYCERARHLATVARVFTPGKNEEAFYRAFKSICDIAEKDIGRKLPWGHLVSHKESSHRIRAILVDEEGAQIKGIGRYFEEKYPGRDGHTHIRHIVKICQVHYERSIQRLVSKGMPADLCDELRILPNLQTKKKFFDTIQTIRQVAESENLDPIIAWLNHKDRNPWVLECLSPALTQMNPTDWGTTSNNTNVAESAHALAQRDGIHLSLVGAVQKGQRIDERFFQLELGTMLYGIQPRYGNTSVSGRKKMSISRKKVQAKKQGTKEMATFNNEAVEESSGLSNSKE